MAINTVINTNMMALTSHRALASVGNRQAKASQRLSTGKKINSAADDAAGLAISEKMKAQIKGLDMAAKNSEDAISLIQTAEGSLTEVNDMLTRVRELTVQAANSTNQKDDRVKIGEEVAALLTEIDSISDRTEFNEKKLTDGSFKDGFFQIGANAGQKLDMSIGNMDVDTLGLDQLKKAFGVTGGKTGDFIDGVQITGKDGTAIAGAAVAAKGSQSSFTVTSDSTTANQDLTATIDYTDVNGNLKSVELSFKSGANVNDTTKALKDAIAANEELAGVFDIGGTNAEVQLTAKQTGDTSIKLEGISLTTSEAGKKIGVEKMSYKPGNEEGQKFTLDTANAFQAGSSITIGDKTYEMVATGGTLGENQFSSIDELKGLLKKDGIIMEDEGTADTYVFKEAGDGYIVNSNMTSDSGKVYSDAIANVDKALKVVTTQRSKLGANQNRLEHTINNLNLSSENLSAAKSRIEDTDMAKEMMNLTSANVLQQAATSMLAQANQAPNKITQLLG